MEQPLSQADNAALRNFSQFNYAAEPFVNQLKSTNDPRGKVHDCTFMQIRVQLQTILTLIPF